MAITPKSVQKNISLEEARGLIHNLVYSNQGNTFTVIFVKRTDGTVRTMNCRGGVKKGQTGGGLKFDPTKKNLVVVYDMNKLDEKFRNLRILLDPEDKALKGAYRMINLETVISVSSGGVLYTVV